MSEKNNNFVDVHVMIKMGENHKKTQLQNLSIS